MQFILIHGTFAKDAPWTKEGSAFQKCLASKLPAATFAEFSWTGANSQLGRVAAGDALAIQLSAALASFPAERLCLIGHSHGGTTALYAISKLDKNNIADRVDVVCLNTPFQRVQPRRLIVIQAFAHVASLLVNVIAPLWLVALPQVSFASALLGLLDLDLLLPDESAGWLSWAAYCILAGVGLVFSAKLLNWFFSAAKDYATNLADSLTVQSKSCHLLNLRTSKDEVPAYLRFWSGLGDVWFFGLPWITLVASVVLVILFSSQVLGFLTPFFASAYNQAAASAWGREGFPTRASVDEQAEQLLSLLWRFVTFFVGAPMFLSVLVTGGQALLVILLITRTLGLSFGDLLLTAFLVKVRIVPEPAAGDAMSESRVVTCERTGLWHSSIYSMEAADEVAAWISSRDGGPSP